MRVVQHKVEELIEALERADDLATTAELDDQPLVDEPSQIQQLTSLLRPTAAIVAARPTASAAATATSKSATATAAATAAVARAAPTLLSQGHGLPSRGGVRGAGVLVHHGSATCRHAPSEKQRVMRALVLPASSTTTRPPQRLKRAAARLKTPDKRRLKKGDARAPRGGTNERQRDGEKAKGRSETTGSGATRCADAPPTLKRAARRTGALIVAKGRVEKWIAATFWRGADLARSA